MTNRLPVNVIAGLRTAFRKLTRGIAGGHGLVLGRDVSISPRGCLTCDRDVRIGNAVDLWGNISIGNGVRIHRDVILRSFSGFITVGAGTTINPFTTVYGDGGVRIGKNVSIATKVTIVAANHIFDNADIPIKEQGSRSRGINIEDDVWIAANCVILDGVTIGKGAVLAAGAVVNRDVDEYSIVGGVPAKPIGSRKAGAD